MNPSLLRMLENVIALVHDFRLLIKDDAQSQYARDRLRDAEEALRSANSQLSRRIGELVAAIERDRRST